MKYKSSSRSQKQKSHRRKSRSHTKRRSSRRVQRGGLILSPSVYSNPSNSHVAGKGFTDTESALTGCIGSPNSATALKGTNVDTIIGGIRMPVVMKGGQTAFAPEMKGGQQLVMNGGRPTSKMMGGRRRSCNKRKCNHKYHRMQRGGSHNINTNGYSIGGVELKPSLSGIANNYHNAYDSCRG